MAFPAIESEIRPGMIRVVGSIEIIDMTAFTLYRSPGELIPALRDMTGIAIGYGMNP